jgi:hypothetical protein
LRKSERNYPVTELESLAIIEGIKAYHPYLATAVNPNSPRAIFIL